MRCAALLVLVACGSRQQSAPAPDPDPDRDRITGAADRCPREPEQYNGTDDDDGCPDKPSARDCVWIDVLEILDRIHFDQGTANIPAANDPILDAVAATLAGNPQIEKLGIVGGHASGEGGQLALARALAVTTALIDRGVPAQRIETHRYDKPISDGAAKNRAVWFVVLRIDGKDTRPSTGDARWAPWDRDCPAKWKAHREQGAPIDCACLDAKPP